MKIGELAAATGLSASAIRFYEQSGLLPPAKRGANGYRDYADEAVERLQLVRMAQGLGFSLDTIRAAFAADGGFSKPDMLRKMDERLHEIDQLLATLEAQRQELRGLRATVEENWQVGICMRTGEPIGPAKTNNRSA